MIGVTTSQQILLSFVAGSWLKLSLVKQPQTWGHWKPEAKSHVKTVCQNKSASWICGLWTNNEAAECGLLSALRLMWIWMAEFRVYGGPAAHLLTWEPVAGKFKHERGHVLNTFGLSLDTDTVSGTVSLFLTGVTSPLLVRITTNFPWALKLKYIAAASQLGVRLTPWIIHSALSTCFGKRNWERKSPCGFSASSFPFCFIINHTTLFPFSPSLSQARVWCAEMHWEPCDTNKAKVAGINPLWEIVTQTGTCVLVSLPLCQQPNWEQLAQRLFYMAGHDRLQLFYCSWFVNGAIWVQLWLELSFMTRRGSVSSCQKDTSCKLPWIKAAKLLRSLSSKEQACSLSACFSWSGRFGGCGGGHRQQQASHFYQRLLWENKRLSSKKRTTMRVYDMISCGDNKSWWILIMTPLALLWRTHHHLSLPRSFVNTARPARPGGCQMELTRSQPALSLLSPAALEGKPSSEAKATSPRQIPLLCHSAGAAMFVSGRVCFPLCLLQLNTNPH